jgi:hypothetical protein
MKQPDALTALAVAAGWHKSSRSQAQNACVEVTTAVPGWVGVRDSTLGAASPILACCADDWTALITDAKDGQLDL